MSKKIEINRRKVLSQLGAFSAITAGVVSIPEKVQAAVEETNVDDLSDSQLSQTVSRARSSEKVEDLVEQFKEDGWEPKYDQAMGTQSVKSNGDSFRSVVIPFDHRSKEGVSENVQTNILWTSADVEWAPALGHQAEKVESVSMSTSSQSTAPKYNVTTYGTVDSEGRTQGQVELSPTADLTTASSGRCERDNYCLADIRVCDNYNWPCVLRTAGSYLSTAICRGCSSGNPYVCAACLGSILLAADATISCNIGTDCHWEQSCYQCEDLPRRWRNRG